MKKHLVIFILASLLLIYGCYVVNIEYFNHPYPNIVEYIASVLLLSYTMVLLFWKKNRRKKIALGGSFVAIVFLLVNVLNYFYEWSPISLNLPFDSSQSFSVNYEPFEWPEAKPEVFDYDPVRLNKYYSKLENWKRLRG